MFTGNRSLYRHKLFGPRAIEGKVVVIMGPPASDGAHAWTAANLTTFRNGKVVEIVHYPDPADALAAIRA